MGLWYSVQNLANLAQGTLRCKLKLALQGISKGWFPLGYMEQRFYVLIMPRDFRVSNFNWGPPVYITPDFRVGLKDRVVHIKGFTGMLIFCQRGR